MTNRTFPTVKNQNLANVSCAMKDMSCMMVDVLRLKINMMMMMMIMMEEIMDIIRMFRTVTDMIDLENVRSAIEDISYGKVTVI